MPASEILKLFRQHKLHSGSHEGPIVKSEAQAKAIQISYARKEGAKIPYPEGERPRGKFGTMKKR